VSGFALTARLSVHPPSNVPEFRPLTETELDRLSSDDLIAYIREARAHGLPEEATRALGILVFRHFEDVKRRVSLKVPREEVEDVAMEAIESAIKSAFDGTAMGQFVNWLHTIVDRRIVDHYRRREARPKTQPLPEEHEEAEDVFGKAMAVVDPENEAAEELADLRAAAERAMPENEVHRRVVDLYAFEDLDAATTAGRINELFETLDPPMSADNVHQIVSRFRKKLRGILEDD
jgi:RNA polymerase sigma factor (sigma-70 family)